MCSREMEKIWDSEWAREGERENEQVHVASRFDVSNKD